MKQRIHKKPTWGALYAIALLLVSLLAAVEVTVPEGGLRSVLEVVVVIATFWLMAKWLRRNRVALELEQWR
jgi:hypothetical protein